MPKNLDIIVNKYYICLLKLKNMIKIEFKNEPLSKDKICRIGNYEFLAIYQPKCGNQSSGYSLMASKWNNNFMFKQSININEQITNIKGIKQIVSQFINQ